jgi:hypothetical protein
MHPCQPSRRERDLDEMWVELQVSEDTCKAHNVFCCPECFEVAAAATWVDCDGFVNGRPCKRRAAVTGHWPNDSVRREVCNMHAEQMTAAGFVVESSL